MIAVFVLDYGAVAVGRIMHLDVLDMAAVIPGMTVVTMDMIMTTLESIAELFGTTITPLVYRLMYPSDPIESRQLARFAVRVYAISNLAAFILYPIISGVKWIGCNITITTLSALVALRTLQYSVINQVGDAAVQMAKPHWLRTFTGTSMQIPGFDLGLYVRTQTTEDTLSAHIALIVFVVGPIVAALYLGVQDDPIPRLLIATLVAFMVMLLSFIFWYKEQVLTCGVQSEVVEAVVCSKGSIDSSDGNSDGNSITSNSDDKPNYNTSNNGNNSSSIDPSGTHSISSLNAQPIAVHDNDQTGNSNSSCCMQCLNCFGCSGKSDVIPLFSLEPFQISLVCLNVIVKVINEQVTNALTAVVLVSLGGAYRNIYIVGAGIVAVLYLVFKISVEHRRMLKRDRSEFANKTNGLSGEDRNNNGKNISNERTRRQHSFYMRLNRWVFVVCLISSCLAISSIILLTRPGINSSDVMSPSPSSSLLNVTTSPSSSRNGNMCQRLSEEGDSQRAQDPMYFTMTIIAIVFILPLYPAIKMFDVEYDAFLMDYERDQPEVVTSMTLWINVLKPIGHLSMLGINYYAWVTASVDVAAGSIQVAVTMLTGVSVLTLLVFYYVVLDRCCLTSKCSVRANLKRMDANLRGGNGSGVGTEMELAIEGATAAIIIL